ncbi:MAG: hypothetical protein EAZ97_08430 [Bacteroidetes bacterium]|nr:MAG: hypothetical protein EAZ97_08430 [Bacteroidota bacterium]
MNTKHTWVIICFLLLVFNSFSAFAQEPKADRFATITVSVVNSEKAYHVALVRYYDKDGEIIINTSEEFKIDISKASRFKTGSIRKTIPIYPNAERIQVTVNNCANLHENDFFISDLDAAENNVTFVFKREFESVIVVKFKGIQQKKPCTFKIKGKNTNTIFYGDYENAQKMLYEEASREDIKVELAESSLYPYKVDGIEIMPSKPEDMQKFMQINVSYIDNSVTDTARVNNNQPVVPAKEETPKERRQREREEKRRAKEAAKKD